MAFRQLLKRWGWGWGWGGPQDLQSKIENGDTILKLEFKNKKQGREAI